MPQTSVYLSCYNSPKCCEARSLRVLHHHPPDGCGSCLVPARRAVEEPAVEKATSLFSCFIQYVTH